MEFPVHSCFLDKLSGEKVSGQIRPTIEPDLIAWTRWQYSLRDEDRSWNWREIVHECISQPTRYECYSALAANELQGFLVLDLFPKSIPEGTAITVDYLATNPSNRGRVGLRHVGFALTAIAVQRSRETGTHGELWLESLSGACGFYESLGMIRQTSPSIEGNAVYVMEQDAAERLLDETRRRGIIRA